MALSTYTPPKDASELEKRRVLADSVKDLAQGKAMNTPDQLLEIGKGLGLSANNMSNLYQKYKNDSATAVTPPVVGASAEPTTSTLPTPTTTPAPTTTAAPTTTPAPTTTTPAATSLFGPKTPNLDQYDAMQSSPFGSNSALD